MTINCLYQLIQSSLHLLHLYLPHFLPKVILQVMVQRTPPSSLYQQPPTHLPSSGSTLVDQKPDLCKTNALRSERSGAWLELPGFLGSPPGQLGHRVITLELQ